MRRKKVTFVYLLHFNEPYFHARHYIGFTSRTIGERLTDHLCGMGARLMQVIVGAGIGWRLARSWEGDRAFERKLKNRKNASQLCPICKGGKGEKW